MTIRFFSVFFTTNLVVTLQIFDKDEDEILVSVKRASESQLKTSWMLSQNQMCHSYLESQQFDQIPRFGYAYFLLPRFVFWIATAAGCTKLQANHDTIQTSSNFTHQEESIRIGTSYAFCVYQNLAAAILSRKLRPWSVLSFGSRLNWGVFLQWCTSPPLHPSWSSPATLANSDDFSGSVGWWESSTAARFWRTRVTSGVYWLCYKLTYLELGRSLPYNNNQ